MPEQVTKLEEYHKNLANKKAKYLFKKETMQFVQRHFNNTISPTGAYPGQQFADDWEQYLEGSVRRMKDRYPNVTSQHNVTIRYFTTYAWLLFQTARSMDIRHADADLLEEWMRRIRVRHGRGKLSTARKTNTVLPSLEVRNSESRSFTYFRFKPTQAQAAAFCLLRTFSEALLGDRFFDIELKGVYGPGDTHWPFIEDGRVVVEDPKDMGVQGKPRTANKKRLSLKVQGIDDSVAQDWRVGAVAYIKNPYAIRRPAQIDGDAL